MNNHEAAPASEIAPLPEDKFLDIEPAFREVAQKYGRNMFALVMNAGMAQQATQALTIQAEKHSSRSAVHAVGVLAQAFNEVSNAYVVHIGWPPELLAQCDRDIALAFKGKIITPGSAILLDS